MTALEYVESRIARLEPCVSSLREEIERHKQSIYPKAGATIEQLEGVYAFECASLHKLLRLRSEIRAAMDSGGTVFLLTDSEWYK